MCVLWVWVCIVWLGAYGIAAAQQPVRIAVAGSMSGPQERLGQALLAGARVAAGAVRQSTGKEIEIIGMDDGGRPDMAASVATSIMARGITFVVGHTAGITSRVGAQTYGPAGVLQILPRGVAGQLPPGPLGRPFQLCPNDEERGAVLADYFSRQMNVRTVGVVYGDTDSDRFAADQIIKALEASGLKSVGLERSAAADIQNSIHQQENKGAEAVVLTSASANVSTLFAARPRSQKVQVVIDWPVTRSLVADGPLQQGPFVPLVLQEIDMAAGLNLPADLAAMRGWGVAASNNALLGYVAVQIIGEGIRRSGSPDARAVATTLRGMNVATLLGGVKVGSDGDQLPRFAVYGLGRGSFRPDGSEVTCANGCRCKDGGCSKDCCSK